MIPARQSTAFEFPIGPVLDADGVAVTDCVIGDFKIKKTTGNFAALNASATLTHVSAGVYDLVATTSDTDTVGLNTVALDDGTNTCASVHLQVMEEVIYDALYAANANTFSGSAGNNTLRTISSTGVTAIQNGLLTTSALLVALQGLYISGDGEAGIGGTGNDTTHVHLPNLTQGDDELNGNLLMIRDAITGEWHSRRIADWVASTQLATVATLPYTPAENDLYFVLSIRDDVTTELAKVPKSDGSVTFNATANSAIGAATEAAILNEGDATALLAAISAKVEEFLINEGDATATLAAIATAVTSALGTGSGLTSLATAAAQTTAQNDLDILTGVDGVVLAANQPNYVPATSSQAVAIKAKTDLIPASPAATGDIPSAATISTQVNTDLGTGAALTSLATQASVTAIAADLPARITKNTALANFMFKMVDSSDHSTAETGLTITATRSLDGAAFAACTNSATEVSNGWYKIDLAAGDLNGNVVVLRFTSAGADSAEFTIVTQVT